MEDKPRWLERAARRTSERSWSLGAALEDYCRIEGVTHEQLALFLRCDEESLAWLALCRRPAPERFSEDVSAISERFQVEAAKLGQIVRHVDAVVVLCRAISSEEEHALLLAARDRDKEKDK